MPSRKFTTLQLLGILLLSVLIPMATVVSLTAAQEKLAASKGESKNAVSHRDQHRFKDFYANVRVLPPATITEIDGNRVYYLFADEGINLGSFDLEPGYSIVPKGLTREKHDGCYGVYFCAQHLLILSIDELDAKFCRVNTN